MSFRSVPDDGMPPGVRWALAIGLTVIGGLSWFVFGWGVASGSFLGILLAAIVPSVTCLAAGWLLRSWWGMAASVVAYVAVSAVMWYWAIVGAGDIQPWTFQFPLVVVLPGAIMGAIGTAIGMYRAGRGGQSAS